MNLKTFFRKHKFLVIVGGIVAVELAIIICFGGFSNLFTPNNSIKGIILFVGEGCAQCDKVDVFLKNNNIREKVLFTELEVFNNAHNADVLADRAQACGLDPSHIGVPFLWNESTCIIGYVDVIEFFRKKIK